MIKNSIVICDDQDKSHGQYFLKAADYATNLLNLNENIVQHRLNSEKCTHAYLEIVEFPKHKEKTIFIICSHGNTTGFSKSNQPAFIDENISCDLCLDGGIVYSIACSTGKVFGEKIVEKKASFYGYENDIEILPLNEEISIECDNYGLFKLINDNKTLKEAKEATQKRYDYHIANLHPMYARTLLKAKKSLVVHGEISKIFF